MSTITKHAQKRLQQRCISNRTIECLEEYGAQQHDGHGSIKIFFNKDSKRKMNNCGIALSQHQKDAYMVKSCDDRVMITAGYRRKRIKRR